MSDGQAAAPQVSQEDLALIQQFKEVVGSNDPVRVEEFLKKYGWDESKASENYQKTFQQYEAEEAQKYGMSVQQYRDARMQEAQAQMQGQMASQMGPAPQGPPQGYPQGYQGQGPQFDPWQGQNPGPYPPQPQPQGPQLPDAAMRDLVDNVSAMRDHQAKEIAALKEQNAKYEFQRQVNEYRGYLNDIYDSFDGKLKGLEGESKEEVVEALLNHMQQTDPKSKVDPKEVLIEMNNSYVERLNKTFEKQLGNSEKNLPLYERPNKEGDVPTLGANQTVNGAAGIGGKEPAKAPEKDLAPKDSMAAGREVIHDSEDPNDPEIKAQEEVAPSSLKVVQEAVEAENKALESQDDEPIGAVNAGAVA